MSKKAPVHREVHHRDSRNGRFITEDQADRRPATTEREVIKYPNKT